MSEKQPRFGRFGFVKQTDASTSASDESSAGAGAASRRQLFYFAVGKIKRPNFFIVVKESGSYE